ncbi:Fc.00g074000.m01.CDS01 [Cosmosporella sp. VM-42]
MGYSEVFCQICGVTFNISRFRSDKEPRKAAWCNTGDGSQPFDQFNHRDELRCPKESGCFFVKRGLDAEPKSFPEIDDIEGSDPSSQWGALKTHFERTLHALNSDDDASDEDYVPSEDSLDSSPYEWDSDYETEAGSDEEEDDESESTLEAETASDILYRLFKNDIHGTPLAETIFAEQKEVRPDDENDENNLKSIPLEASEFDLEHIAGSRCTSTKAYNGNRISAEAMRGCNTLQCLLRKTDGKPWSPLSDDEEYEASGSFFLTGLSDHSPSTDTDYPSMFPIRHGVEYPAATNHLYDADDEAMPFHPACLEIFKRASLLRHGEIDIEGLGQWWVAVSTSHDFWEFPRDQAIENGREQWWQHNQGDEWLAANPCFVPGLESLLSSVRYPTCLDPRDRELAVLATHIDAATPDSFECLPNELRTMIMLNLSFKDVANLRLASRAFRQIPQSLIYNLTLCETPWLYEAWSSLPISFWATTTAKILKKEAESVNYKMMRVREVLQVLRQEAARLDDEPGYNEEAIDAVKQQLAELEKESLRPTASPPLLIPSETDWYRLWTELNRNFEKLPGLRNRRRIWEDCEEILYRIGQRREEGNID